MKVAKLKIEIAMKTLPTKYFIISQTLFIQTPLKPFLESPLLSHIQRALRAFWTQV